MDAAVAMGKTVCVGLVLALVALVAIVEALPSERIRRGYNSGAYGDVSGGFGRSDERDASVSGEGCGGGGGGGYSQRGYGYSGSRELAYNRDGRPSGETRGGRSFTRATASAVAAASSYKQSLP